MTSNTSMHWSPYKEFAVQPYNILLEFLIEWGTIGAGFLYLLIRAFIKGLKLHVLNNLDNSNTLALSAGAAIISFSLHSLVDGSYYHPQPSFYLAIAFTIWIIPWHRKDESVG